MSFAGKLVKITLRSGESYPARIVHVDPTTAMLTVERSDTNTTEHVRRDVLQDVSIVSEGSAAAASAATAAAQAPATAPAAAASRSTPPTSDKKKRNKAKKTPAPGPAAASAPAPPANPYLEEFDYTKSTQSFDKKKAWEEIRVRRARAPVD